MNSASPLLDYNVDGFFSEMQARLDVQRAFLAEIQDRSLEVLAADAHLAAAPSLPKSTAPGQGLNRAIHSDVGRAISPLAASVCSVVSVGAGSIHPEAGEAVTGAQLLRRFGSTFSARVPSHAVAAYEDVSVKICGLLDEFLTS